MKYLATIKFGQETWAEIKNTEKEAQQWLDEKNNNLEHTASIDFIDEDGVFVDGYIYNKGIE